METWAHATERWREALIAGGAPETTIRLRTGWVTRIGRAVGGSPWTVTGDELLAWGGAHSWARDTRRAAYASIRAFYRWGIETGTVEVSPADALPTVRQSGPRPHPVPDRVYGPALEAAAPETALMMRLAAEAGLRRAEVAAVHADDIIDDLIGKSLIVHGKGGKQRIVPLPDALARDLEERAAGGWAFPARWGDGHMTPGAVGDRVCEALPDGWTMHGLRHRFASRAYGATGDVLAVQAILGHASPATTLRYVVVDPARLRAAMAAAA